MSHKVNVYPLFWPLQAKEIYVRCFRQVSMLYLDNDDGSNGNRYVPADLWSLVACFLSDNLTAIPSNPIKSLLN